MEKHNTYLEPDWQGLATRLETYNSQANQGRGFSFLETMIDDLRNGHFVDARVNATQQSDKWGSVDFDIKELVKRELFNDHQSPWESSEDFYWRLYGRDTIVVDTRFGENDHTYKGISDLLKEEGWQEMLPSIALTTTKFQPGAKFKTVQTTTEAEVLQKALDQAETAAKKKFIGKVVVRIFNESQKDAVPFIRTLVKEQYIDSGWNTRSAIWTESDGLLIAKAKRFETGENPRIEASVLKRSVHNLEEKLEELLNSHNLPGQIAKSGNPDYVNFTIDLNRAHNSNLAFDSLEGRINNWFR